MGHDLFLRGERKDITREFPLLFLKKTAAKLLLKVFFDISVFPLINARVVSSDAWWVLMVVKDIAREDTHHVKFKERIIKSLHASLKTPSYRQSLYIR